MPPSVQVIDIIPDLGGEDEDAPVMTEDEVLVAHLEFGSSEDATRKSRRDGETDVVAGANENGVQLPTSPVVVAKKPEILLDSFLKVMRLFCSSRGLLRWFSAFVKHPRTGYQEA